MKRLLAPVLAGAAVAGLLYGLLSAAERRLPEPEDPWLDAWVADGIKAEFRAGSTEPQNHLLPGDLRPLAGAELAGTQMRNYIVQNTSVQVVRLPKAGLLPQVIEGRVFEARFKPQGNPVHVDRVGRTILFVSSTSRWVPFAPQTKTSRRDLEAMFDSFEETVRRYP